MFDFVTAVFFADDRPDEEAVAAVAKAECPTVTAVMTPARIAVRLTVRQIFRTIRLGRIPHLPIVLSIQKTFSVG